MNSHRNLLSFSDQKSFLKLSESTVTMTSIKLKKKRHLLSPDPIKSEISRTNGGRKTDKGYRNRNAVSGITNFKTEEEEPENSLEEQVKVQQLYKWEEKNLEYQEGDYATLLSLLKTFYQKENNDKKLNELDKIDNIYNSSKGINHSKLIYNKTLGKINKIIEKELLEKQKEQSSIFMNSISKTRHRFSHLLFQKDVQDKLSSKLSLNRKVLSTMKNDLTGNETRYRQIIENQTKLENIMKKDMSEIIGKMKINKEEKQKLTESIDETYSMKRQKEFQCKKMLDKFNKELESGAQKKDFAIQLKSARLEIQFKKKHSEEEAKLSKIKEDLSNLKEKMRIINLEESYLKCVYHSLLKEQREYFCRILKNGFDVRNDGLIWVVKRLFELKTEIDENNFPKFLEEDEIQYIISQAKFILHENILLKNIAEIKKNQKIRIEEEMKEYKDKLIDVHLRPKPKALSPNKTYHALHKLTVKFSLLKTKYQNGFTQKAYERLNKEDAETKQLMKDSLRSILFKKDLTQKKKFIDPLKMMMLQDATNREDFEKVTTLQELLIEIKKAKIKLKRKMIDHIKEKEELVRNNLNIENSISFDLTYGALFGKEIILKSEMQ